MFPVDAKILMVDDSGFSRSLLKSALKELKFWKIIEATNASEAQICLMQEEQRVDPVHLIFCDQNMPEMTGLAFIKWLRGQERFSALPVIMLTTSQERGVIIEAGLAGISGYMIKPFDLNALKGRLAATWEKTGRKYYESNKQS